MTRHVSILVPYILETDLHVPMGESRACCEVAIVYLQAGAPALPPLSKLGLKSHKVDADIDITTKSSKNL